MYSFNATFSNESYVLITNILFVLRKISIHTFLVFTISACSNPDDFGLESSEFVLTEQKWQLVKMSIRWTNDEKTGDAMEWQEYFHFSPDSTFSKFRTMNGNTDETAVTFAVVQYENEADDYLELNFESGTV